MPVSTYTCRAKRTLSFALVTYLIFMRWSSRYTKSYEPKNIFQPMYGTTSWNEASKSFHDEFSVCIYWYKITLYPCIHAPDVISAPADSFIYLLIFCELAAGATLGTTVPTLKLRRAGRRINCAHRWVSPTDCVKVYVLFCFGILKIFRDRRGGSGLHKYRASCKRDLLANGREVHFKMSFESGKDVL